MNYVISFCICFLLSPFVLSAQLIQTRIDNLTFNEFLEKSEKWKQPFAESEDPYPRADGTALPFANIKSMNECVKLKTTIYYYEYDSLIQSIEYSWTSNNNNSCDSLLKKTLEKEFLQLEDRLYAQFMGAYKSPDINEEVKVFKLRDWRTRYKSRVQLILYIDKENSKQNLSKLVLKIENKKRNIERLRATLDTKSIEQKRIQTAELFLQFLKNRDINKAKNLLPLDRYWFTSDQKLRGWSKAVRPLEEIKYIKQCPGPCYLGKMILEFESYSTTPELKKRKLLVEVNEDYNVSSFNILDLD